MGSAKGIRIDNKGPHIYLYSLINPVNLILTPWIRYNTDTNEPQLMGSETAEGHIGNTVDMKPVTGDFCRRRTGMRKRSHATRHGRIEWPANSSV